MADFADREATSIIGLVRSLSHSPDLHGLIAAKLRVVRQEGKLEGVTACIVTMSKPDDELPEWSQDGFQPARRDS